MTPRKKKTYLTVIALGGVALLVDRFVLPTPVSDPQEAIAASPHPAKPAGAAPKAVSGWSIPELPFPRGLSAYRADAAVRDLFAPPGSSSAGGRDRAGAPGDNRSRRPSSAASFPERHKLSGVVLLEGLRIAIVDDGWLRVGELLDGCSLTEIGDNRVRFRCPDGEASLEVIGSPNPSRR